MAREYSRSDAKELIKKHNEILDDLKTVSQLTGDYFNQIRESANNLAREEILNILRGVSVDEITKYKPGFRVKPLKDSGFTNIADLVAMSRYTIASLRGISEDGSYTIKAIVTEIYQKTSKEVKIKLSTDRKNKYSSALVIAISVYKNSAEFIKLAEVFLKEHKAEISDLISSLKSSNGVLKWIFSSKKKKEQSNNVYKALTDMLESDYGKDANHIIDNINRIDSTTSDQAWADFSENNIQFYNILEESNPGLLGTDDILYGLPEDLAREIQDECFFPDGLLCTLRGYQEWGVKYILHQERVLLGDEMGLGKTIQAIATMVSLKNTGATHFVVICPASVITNWCREIIKHSKLRVIKVHGSGRSGALKAWLNAGGVAVTTYETTAHFKLDDDFKFSLAVVDEAHYIKNPGANRSVNTRNICFHAERLLFMTGTALENKVDEMINLITVLRPDIASEIKLYSFMSAAPQFREKVAPVYYRRKREDVLTELPEKIESKEWCTLNLEEEKLYEDAILNKQYAEARRLSWNVENLEHSTKANRMREIIEEAESEGRKVLVFSYFLDTIRKIHEFLGTRCMNPINGLVNVNRRQEIIDEFDKAPAGSVLLAQIQSGGTGLNIQSASVVIICEPQFKPSIENQAISRVYRMGQSRNVLVYRLLCEQTIDEKLIDVLEEKQRIFDEFADKSVAAEQTIEIDDKTFGTIIKEEIERISKKKGIPVVTKEDVDAVYLGDKPKAPELKSYEYKKVEEQLSGKDYYDMIMEKSYDELVQYLINKYGPAKYDYFTNEYCTMKNKNVSRTKEGLYCHHIDEDKAIMLSNDQFASKNPFEYQKANRLVYCNFLEHFLLHILIAEEPKNKDANPNEMQGIGGAINFMCRQLNDLYNGYEYKQEWMRNVANVVKDDYESYIKMLKRLWNFIKKDDFYSMAIPKQFLAMGWDGQIYDKILKELK